MSVVFHSSSFTSWNFLFTIQVYKLTVVHEGEPMLGRHNGRLVISTFWFVTSSLVFLFTFLWRRFKRLVARGDVNSHCFSESVVAMWT